MELVNTLASLGIWQWAALIVSVWVLQFCGHAIYHLYFSPLAKFPGPKIAAATVWCETYYSLIFEGGGRFYLKIAEWHDIYGPIIRINPYELHIRDSEYLETVYSQGSGINKAEWSRYMFSLPVSVGSTVESNIHRTRKAPLLPFFSKTRVHQQSANIYARLETMCDRLNEQFVGNSKPVNLCDLFSCFTGDIITRYAFGKAYDFLAYPRFQSPFAQAVNGFKKAAQISIQFPTVPKVLSKIPDSWLLYLRPSFAPVADFKKEVLQLIAVERAKKNEEKSRSETEHESIFGQLLDSDLPPQQLETHRLMEEGVALLGAAIDTTKWSAAVTMFHLLSNPDKLARVRQELDEAFGDSSTVPSLPVLEKLPYFMASIEEGIRLSYGGFARSPRCHSKPLRYGSWIIPPHTPVGTDVWSMHHDEEVFPDSFTYQPERWLDDPKTKTGKSLSRYSLAFGKGTRGCLGRQLAYAEMQVLIAALLRRYELELYETTRKDVDVYSDAAGPAPHPDSVGVRVRVQERKL